LTGLRTKDMKLGTDLSTLAKVTGGRLLKGSPPASFDSFVTDTRKLKCGEFFWALQGATYDAHDFLGQAAPCAAGFLARESALAELKELPPAVYSIIQ